MTLTEYRIAEGAPEVHEHHHPEEEAWTVIDGDLEVWVDGEPRRLQAGEAIVIPPDTPHRVRALRASHALVIDAPVRRHLPGTSH